MLRRVHFREGFWMPAATEDAAYTDGRRTKTSDRLSDQNSQLALFLWRSGFSIAANNEGLGDVPETL